MHGGNEANDQPGSIIGWPGRGALLAAAFLPVLALYGFGIALPPIAAAFGRDPNAMLLSQLIGSIVGFAFAFGSPVVGGLIDRFGYRSVLIVAAAAFAVAGGIGGLLDSLYAILATRIVLGFTVAGGLIASLAGIGSLASSARVRMYGWQAMAGGLLAIAVYPAVGTMASLGWRWPFALHLAALVIIPLAWTLPRGRIEKTVTDDAPRRLLAGVSPLLICVAAFMGMAGIVGPIFAPFFLTRIGIADPALQSLPLMAMSTAAIIASAFFGRIHGLLGITGTFAVAICLVGAGLMLCGLTHSLTAFAAALALVGVGSATFSPNVSAAVIAACTGRQGQALGVISAALYGSQAFFPFIANAINGRAGPAAVFAAFGATALAIGLAFTIGALAGRRTRALSAPEYAAARIEP